MHRLLYFFLLFSFFIACKSEPKNQLPPEAQPTSVEKINQEIEGFAAPESIIADEQYLYVSNVGATLAPTTQDGDGFISRLDKTGKMEGQQFIQGLDAPKGMAIQGGNLYVADVDKVRGFQLSDGAKIFELSLAKEGLQFLNDIVSYKNGVLLVSATDVGKIYEINTEGTGSYKALDIDGDIGGANGLFYDRKTNQLFVNSFGVDNKPNGPIGKINMGVKGGKLTFSTLGEYKGMLDGLTVLGSNFIVFSDWAATETGGGLVMMDLIEKQQTNPIKLSKTIAGPADFYYDSASKIIWIPMMQENKVLMEAINL